jgi:hypothetical protein
VAGAAGKGVSVRISGVISTAKKGQKMRSAIPQNRSPAGINANRPRLKRGESLM